MITTTASPLLAAVAERRQRREQERAEHERQARAYSRAYSRARAEKRRDAWIVEIDCDPSATAALRLLSLRPHDAQIVPDDHHIYFDGSARLCADATINVGIILCEEPGAVHTRMNVHCVCEPQGWEITERAILVPNLYDTIVGAAEALLLHVDARCGFEPESA